MRGQPSAAKHSANAIRYLGVGLNIRTARLTALSACGGHCAGPCDCEHRNLVSADVDTLSHPQGFRVRLIDGLNALRYHFFAVAYAVSLHQKPSEGSVRASRKFRCTAKSSYSDMGS